MGLKEDLTTEVKDIFREQWEVNDTSGVPDPEDLRLSNHAKNLGEATILYADLDGSTKMVDDQPWTISAEVYKAYLRCAARIIKGQNGTITAYDGDRIMAVFTGTAKNTEAVRAALQLNYAVINIINPAFKNQYPMISIEVKHSVGIDTSEIRAARIGVRGFNDLVWIGRAANYAAKLTNLSDKPVWITKVVHDSMNAEVKYTTGTTDSIWQERSWTPMNNMTIYSTGGWSTL